MSEFVGIAEFHAARRRLAGVAVRTGLHRILPEQFLGAGMAVPAFDDPERNLLILYRLDAVAAPGMGKPGRRRSLAVPHKLRTKVGEQPTVQQLTH